MIILASELEGTIEQHRIRLKPKGNAFTYSFTTSFGLVGEIHLDTRKFTFSLLSPCCLASYSPDGSFDEPNMLYGFTCRNCKGPISGWDRYALQIESDDFRSVWGTHSKIEWTDFSDWLEFACTPFLDPLTANLVSNVIATQLEILQEKTTAWRPVAFNLAVESAVKTFVMEKGSSEGLTYQKLDEIESMVWQTAEDQINEFLKFAGASND